METERYVLFSPVGMTDPISGNRDGSMLHIARGAKFRRLFNVHPYSTTAPPQNKFRRLRHVSPCGGELKSCPLSRPSV